MPRPFDFRGSGAKIALRFPRPPDPLNHPSARAPRRRRHPASRIVTPFRLRAAFLAALLLAAGAHAGAQAPADTLPAAAKGVSEGDGVA